MGSMASQITSFTIVYSTVYSRPDQRNTKAPRHSALWPVTGEFPAQRAINAEKIYMKYDTGFNKITYTQYKNQLTSILKRHEKEYYKSLLETNKNNLKKKLGLSSEML